MIRLIENQNKIQTIPFNLGEILNDEGHVDNIKLSAGDRVIAYSKQVFSASGNVNVYGVVKNPGSYSFKEKYDFKDLILQAGGMSDNIFQYRVEITRIDPDSIDEQYFAQSLVFDIENKFSVNDFEKTASDNILNFKLIPYDDVFLRPDPNFTMQKSVLIQGEVSIQGDIQFYHQMKLYTIL